MAGLGAGAMMLPISPFAKNVDPARLLDQVIDVKQKKQLADVALNTAKSNGATSRIFALVVTSINLSLHGRTKFKTW
jgi:hypothetical protein